MSDDARDRVLGSLLGRHKVLFQEDYAAIDRLILEVQASMPCYREQHSPVEWHDDLKRYVKIPIECNPGDPCDCNYCTDILCPSCTARMKLNELKVQT